MKFLVLKSEEVVVEVNGRELRGMATANECFYEFITRHVPTEFMRDVDPFTLTTTGRHVHPYSRVFNAISTNKTARFRLRAEG